MTNDLTTTGNPRLSLIESMAAGYNMDPNKFAATIKATCIKGQCSNEQFAAFLMVAHKHRLNPVTKEIYAFPQDGGIQPIVSVDGWHKLANDHPAYDGVEYEDHIVDGKLVAITARIFRKDRSRPTPATEYMAECERNTQPWKKWPARMLRHKAFIQAARAAFGFSGIMEPDEFERQHDSTPTPIESRFDGIRKERMRPRYDAIEHDEVPARDINEDPETIDATPSPESGVDAGEEENSGDPQTPEVVEAKPADDTSSSQQSDGMSDAQRFYYDALGQMKKAKTKEARTQLLMQISDDPMWKQVPESKQDQIIKAAGAE